MPRGVQSERIGPALINALRLDGFGSNPELDDETINAVIDAGQGGWLDVRRWAQNQLVASPGNVTWYLREGGPSLQGGDARPLPSDVWFIATDFVCGITNTDGLTTETVRVRVEEEDPPKAGFYTRYFDQDLTVAAVANARASVNVNGIRWVFRPDYHPRVRTTGGTTGCETSIHVHGMWARPGVEIPR